MTKARSLADLMADGNSLSDGVVSVAEVSGAAPLASPSFTGDISVTGTVDGRDVAADGTKLDGIEAGATADQTPAQIKTAYESNANTNEFSDAEQSKLAGIEAGATGDQTASEIRALVEAATDSNVFTDADHTKLNAIEANAKDDQTITAGSGLTGGGTGDVTLSHSDTSAQASVDNSGATVIQDVTLDTYGHVTGLGSHTLTLANLGYTGATNANYITNNNQLTNGAGYTTNVGDITGVTAGTNLSGGGTSGTVTLNVSSNPSFTDVYVADQILHTGDTDTYMQFHAANQWRVVTGGAERLEVNNSQITSTEPIHAPSFHGNGSQLTGIQSSAPVGTSYSSPSRSGGNTVYQNTSSNVRIVYIGGHGSVDYIYVSPNNSSWYTIYNTGGGTGWYEMNHTTLVVPPGHYYRYSGTGYSYWVELT